MRRTAVVSVLVLACGARGSEILVGSGLPEEQGWTRYTNIVSPLDVSTDGIDLHVNTWGATALGAPGEGPFCMWQYLLAAVPENYALDFTMTWEMQVYRAAYNLYDGGVVMMGSYSPGAFTGTAPEREQTLVFLADGLGWGDQSDWYAMDTSDAQHSYRLTVNESGADFYVDGALALDRASFVTGGYLGFGDQTNDFGCDGDFRIRGISVSDVVLREIPVIPAPGTMLLGVAGAALVGWLRRRGALRENSDEYRRKTGH